MLKLLCQLILLGASAAARLAGLPLAAPERLAWEREQLAAWQRGDKGAFSELYRAYAGLLYARVVLPILKQPAAAEDALADTFERAHGKRRDARVEDRSLYFWLARIARNRALDVLRRGKVERLAKEKLEAGALLLGIEEPNAESQLAVRDEEQLLTVRIRAVLEVLHPRYRQALQLRILEERSREACAGALGVSVPTFDVVLLRALRAFRKSFEQVEAV